MYLLRSSFVCVSTLSVAAFVFASTSASAAPCPKRPTPKYLACIEKKADDAAAAAKAAQAAVPGQVAGALQGVKIEWAAHPGVCLFFKDWNNNGSDEHTARTVLGCGGQENYRFNIHK